MKKISLPLLFFYFFLLYYVCPSFAATDSPFYHRDIFIREATEASLDQLIRPVLRKNSADKQFTVFFPNYLYLQEGARLFLYEPSEIYAERIVLKPKSGIYSLGHPVRIQTEQFDAVHCGDRTTLLTKEQRIECMGRVDSTLPPGSDGAPGTLGADGRDSKLERDGPDGNLPFVREDGTDGGKGGDATDGKDAGSQTIQVRHLRGGYFLANGSNGGTGGKGGNGGKAGSGLKESNGRLRSPVSGLVEEPQAKGFLDGGVGGRGESGGNGGNGGAGAAVNIYFETKSDDAEEMLLVVNHGGERGRGESPGKGGDGGEAGLVMERVPSGHGATMVRFNGMPGRPGPNGRGHGRDGQQGIDGPPPVVEYRKYDGE